MKTLIQAAVVTLFAASTAQAQEAVQWRVQDGGNGHWYLRIQTEGVISWNAAKASAEALGGSLSCHETLAENFYVWQHAVQPVQQGWDAWIGLQRVGGQWRWLTGPTTYTSWTFNSPDGDCGGASYAHFHQSGPTWNDLTENGIYCFPANQTCGTGRVCSFLVEWSADCNNDGIVDFGQILTGQFQDVNRNGIPDRVCDCLGDLDADGAVTGADLGQVLAAWGAASWGAPADLNADGSIDGFDLAYLLAGWGPCAN